MLLGNFFLSVLLMLYFLFIFFCILHFFLFLDYFVAAFAFNFVMIMLMMTLFLWLHGATWCVCHICRHINVLERLQFSVSLSVISFDSVCLCAYTCSFMCIHVCTYTHTHKKSWPDCEFNNTTENYWIIKIEWKLFLEC